MTRRSAIRHKGGVRSAPGSVVRTSDYTWNEQPSIAEQQQNQRRLRMASEGNVNSYVTKVNQNRRRLSELRKISRKMKTEMSTLDEPSKVTYQGYLDSHGDKANHMTEQTDSEQPSEILSWLPTKTGLENRARSSVNLDDRKRPSGVFSFVKSFVLDPVEDDPAVGSALKSNDLPLVSSESSQSTPMFFCGQRETEKLKTMDSDLTNSGGENNLRTSLEHIPEDGVLEPQPITLRKMLGNIGKTNSDASLSSCTSYSSVFSDGTISSGSPTSGGPTSLESGCTESTEILARQLSGMFGEKTVDLPIATSAESTSVTYGSTPSDSASSGAATSADANWQQSSQEYISETSLKQLTKASYNQVIKSGRDNLEQASYDELIDSNCNQTTGQSNKQLYQSSEVYKALAFDESDQEQGPSSVLQAGTDIRHNYQSEHLSKTSGSSNTSETILLEKSKADGYPRKSIRKPKKKSKTLTGEKPVVTNQQYMARKRRNTLDGRTEHQKLARLHPSFSHILVQKKETLTQDTISILGQDSSDGTSDQSFTNRQISRTATKTELSECKLLSSSGASSHTPSKEKTHQLQTSALSVVELNNESETIVPKGSEKRKCHPNWELKMLALTDKSLKVDSEILAQRRNKFSENYKQASVGATNNRDETMSLLIRKRLYRSVSDPYLYIRLNEEVYFSTSYERSVAKDHSNSKYTEADGGSAKQTSDTKQSSQSTEKETVSMPNNQTLETQYNLKGASSDVDNFACKNDDILQISSLSVMEKVLTESNGKVQREENASSATRRDNGEDTLVKNSSRRGSLPVLDSTNSGLRPPQRTGLFRKSLGTSSKANEIKSLCASVNVSSLKAGFEKKQEDEHKKY